MSEPSLPTAQDQPASTSAPSSAWESVRRAFTPPADIRRDLVEVVTLFITLRIVLGILAFFVWFTGAAPGPCHFELARNGWSVVPPLDDHGIAFPLVGVWQRWDACWYTNIAANGYAVDNSVSFWPLFPSLTSFAGSLLGGDVALGGLVVNGFAYVIAMLGLMRLVGMDFGRRVASRTVLFISVFPAAFFLFAPFTEAVFLATSVWAIYGARRHLWMVAGVAALLAGFSRIQGVFLIFPIGWEVLRYWRSVLLPEDGETAGESALPSWSQLIGPGLTAILPVVAFTTFVVFASQTTGQTPLSAQDAWGGNNFHAPWETITAAWNFAIDHHNVVELLSDLCLILFLGGVLVGLFRLPFSYSLFALPQVMLAAVRIQPTPLTSTPRIMLVVFPVFVVLALVFKDRRLERGWLLLSVMLLAYLVSMFVRGDFVA